MGKTDRCAMDHIMSTLCGKKGGTPHSTGAAKAQDATVQMSLFPLRSEVDVDKAFEDCGQALQRLHS